MAENPWHRWGIVKTYRDGWPALSEEQLWRLEGTHRDAVERAPDGVFLHLDTTYRVVRLPDRSWVALEPVPPRSRAG